MEPTQHSAEAMLRGAGAVETAVRASAPREHPLYDGMGITVLLVGLAVDLNDAGGAASAVGASLVLLALAVTVVTNALYYRRYRQVRSRTTPLWLEGMLGLVSAGALFSLGLALDDTVAYSFTLGGVAGAAPFLLWALRLRRSA